jgi:predicted transcriptional regulator
MQEGWPAHDVIHDVRILVPGNVIEPASQSQNITTRDDLTLDKKIQFKELNKAIAARTSYQLPILILH